MVNAVLFDMDGVIVDTEPLHHKAYKGMFEAFQIDISDDLYRTFTGQSTNNICKYLVANYGLNCDAKLLVDKKRAIFKSLFKTDSSLNLIEGVFPLIESYYSNGLKLVLASSASMETINLVFDRFELHPYFTGKISGNDLKDSKPHPEIFLKAAKMAKTPTKQCIVIEDSTNGVKAAHAAGIFCIAYDSKNSKNQDYSLADYVITDFNEIRYSELSKLKA